MKLGNYKGIEVEKPTVHITDEDVLNILKKKQKKNAVAIHIDDRPAQTGDQVILDFESSINGVPVPNGRTENCALTLGAHKFVPGFENQIIGHLTGDSFDIHVTFPDDYRTEQLRGKPVTFHTTLKRIQLSDFPDLDDEFAKDFSSYQTLEEWKNAIRETLVEQGEENAYEQLSKNLLTCVIENSEIPVDDDLKNALAQDFFDDFVETLSAYHVSLDTYCQRTRSRKEDLYQKYEAEALRSLQEQSVLHAVATAENITVSREDLLEEISAIAAEEESSLELLLDDLGEEEIAGIEDQLRMDQAMRIIMEHAIIR